MAMPPEPPSSKRQRNEISPSRKLLRKSEAGGVRHQKTGAPVTEKEIIAHLATFAV